MTSTFAAFALLLTAALASGCSKNVSPVPAGSTVVSSVTAAPAIPESPSDTDAIAGSIQQHLKDNKGINMTAMDMVVDKVTVNGDQAQADIEFRLKQGGTTMSMTYFLEGHAGGWVVTSSKPGGGHAAMDKIPPGASNSSLPDVSDYFQRNR